MKKNKIVMLIFLLFSLILLSACAAKSTDTQLDRKILPMTEGGGISYGIYGLDGEIAKSHEFILDESYFHKILSVSNYYDEDINFSMIVLVDFVQVEFQTNDNKDYRSYDIPVKAGEAEQIEFRLSNIQEGTHNLVILLFENLEDHEIESEFRKKTDFSNFVSYSGTIKYGSKDENYLKYDFGKETSLGENTEIDAIMLNLEETKLVRCLSATTEEVKTKFYVHIGNASKQEKLYAYVMFDGVKQISINNQKVVTLSLPECSMVNMKIDIEELDDSVHELSAIRFEINPESGEVVRIDNSTRVAVTHN